MSIELLERAVARLEELKAGATGDPGSWRWYGYGISGQTLAAPNPMPGESVFGGPAFGHDLNVLKTTNDWAPTEADQELIVALSRTVDPLLSILRQALTGMQLIDQADGAADDMVQAGLALARAVLGERDGE